MDKELLNGIPEEENPVTEASEETAEEVITVETETAGEETAEDAENAAPEAGEETDENIPDVEEEVDDSLCIICGENCKGEDSDYCADCEAAMYKSKVPFLAWISPISPASSHYRKNSRI